jgi:signal transduction histidine kinase
LGVAFTQLDFGFVGVLLAVSWCHLVYHRERSIEKDESIARLDGVVAKLAEANLGYQVYASEAGIQSQREERHRITRELHDIIGYTFTNNIMMLEAAVSKIQKDPAKVQQLIELARENSKTGLEKIRHSLYLLRSSELPRTTSIRRVHKLIQVFEMATGINVRADYANTPSQLDDETESFLYYFVQEALTNAFRHGEATSIRVYIFRAAARLVVSVLDNGRGAGEIQEGIGITGMRERLAKLGGALTIARRAIGFEIMGEVLYPGEASGV